MIRKEKIRKDDFKLNELPHTRKELFFDTLKHQFGGLVKVSLLQLFFMLPLFVDFIVFNVLIAVSYNMDPTSFNAIFSLTFYGVLIAIPCIVIMFIGFSGLFNSLKRFSYSEGVLARNHFFYGIKENFKQAIVIGLIYSLSFFAITVGSTYLLFFQQEIPSLVGLGIALLVIQFLVISIMSIYALGQIVTYSNKLGAVIKNSLIFALMRFPINLLLFILFPGIFIALFLINNITSYISMGILAFFISIFLFIWMLVLQDTFDKFINKEYYPELVGKGLYKEESKE